MKTIFIIISGLADVPDELHEGRTPLMEAATPSLDALAKCGCCGAIRTVPDNIPLTKENAVLSLLGYDFRRGIPTAEELQEYGESTVKMMSGATPFFIIPRFSGHGITCSGSDRVTGIGKMALLKQMEVRTLCEEVSINKMRSLAAVKAIEYFEFVLLHIEIPDYHESGLDPFEEKVRAIETIDSEVITPIADYVWNAKEQMNMVVTTDCITSCRSGELLRGDVPAVVYFNDDLPYDTDRFDEQSVLEGPLNAPLPGDLIHKLITFDPISDPKDEAL